MKHPVLKRSGVIRRADFANYLRTLAPHLGFHLDSPDFESARDTGNGLHIRRRRTPYAGLELELEDRWQIGTYCFAVEDGGVIYTRREVTGNYENGTITQVTLQPDPGPHYWGPGDTAHTCEYAEITNDQDPEFDYGAFVDEDAPAYSGALDAADLLPLVTAAVEAAGAPYIAASWSWLATDAAPTGIIVALGSWDDNGSALTSRRVFSYRYRWRNTGSVPLDIAWEQGGGSLSTSLSVNETSDWYVDTIPATQAVTDEIDNVVIELA
jgi:hypothetical protein